jgi:hypothetical protein
MARLRKQAEPKAKSSFIVRTDVVHVAGTPNFYGDRVKLSPEDAKPLLREGKVSKE